MELWEIILRNVSAVLIVIGVFALVMLALGGTGLWLLNRMERRRYQNEVKVMHRACWDGTASTELYCWIKVRWDLEQQKAPPKKIAVVDDYIDECKKRHDKYRTIMLKTGRPIRVTKTETHMINS